MLSISFIKRQAWTAVDGVARGIGIIEDLAPDCPGENISLGEHSALV
jgi:hypothetical protein